MRPIDKQIHDWHEAGVFYARMARECCPEDRRGWLELLAAAALVLDALKHAKTVFDECVFDTNLLEAA